MCQGLWPLQPDRERKYEQAYISTCTRAHRFLFNSVIFKCLSLNIFLNVYKWKIVFPNETWKKLSHQIFWQWMQQSLTHMVEFAIITKTTTIILSTRLGCWMDEHQSIRQEKASFISNIIGKKDYKRKIRVFLQTLKYKEVWKRWNDTRDQRNGLRACVCDCTKDMKEVLMQKKKRKHHNWNIITLGPRYPAAAG